MKKTRNIKKDYEDYKNSNNFQTLSENINFEQIEIKNAKETKKSVLNIKWIFSVVLILIIIVSTIIFIIF